MTAYHVVNAATGAFLTKGRSLSEARRLADACTRYWGVFYGVRIIYKV